MGSSLRCGVLELRAKSVYLRLWAESRGPRVPRAQDPSTGQGSIHRARTHPPGRDPLTTTVLHCPPAGEHLVGRDTVHCPQQSTVLQQGNI